MKTGCKWVNYNMWVSETENEQFLNYYRNDYNRDKNNRRNEYRSNNGHEEKQKRYNKNPRHDNSNNVINFQQANNNHQNGGSEEIHVIVPETKDNDRMNSFLVKSSSQ